MPRQPILPIVDWKEVFESGRTYADWVQQGDAPDNRRRIEANLHRTELKQDVATRLGALSRRVYIVAIAEDWCGDVVRHVPVLQRMAAMSPNLAVRYISREQRPDIFVRYLTNGGEAIPIFVFLNDTFTECGNWGPMPSACREVIARGKACGDVAAARQRTNAMYAADPQCTVVADEITCLIDIASSTIPQGAD